MTTENRRWGLLPAARRVFRGWQNAQAEMEMLARHVSGFGVARGPSLYLRHGRKPSAGRVRLAQAEVRQADVHATFDLRLGTSDISVFNCVFRWNEYAYDFANPPRVIVDAGAYTGLSAAYFAIRYPDAQIIALEPDAGNFELLLRNTARFSNVHPVRAALWSHSGSVSLYDPGRDAWGLRVAETGEPGAAGPAGTGGTDRPDQATAAVTVADLIEQFSLDRIDLLKVDIEGSEKEVFAASDDWIDKVDGICLELHDRFNPGCSRSFFAAVGDFPIESWRGEHVLVLRPGSRLAPDHETLASR